MSHIKYIRYSIVPLAALLITTLLLSACASDAKPTITVSSKQDTEGALLGNIISLVLEDDGFTVSSELSLGGTGAVRTAIAAGDIDIYPEYTGNGAFFFPSEAMNPAWRTADAGYELVKMLDAEANDITWLTPAPANNTWAIAVRAALAERESLATLSDLSDYIDGGGEIVFATSAEFATRPDGLNTFQTAYGFQLSADQLLTFDSGDTTLTARAAANRTDDATAALAYTTDGALADFDLIPLTDDRATQPVYRPAPIIRASVLADSPEIESLLAPVFRSLTTEKLQQLNAKIVTDRQPAATVARDYLTSEGFIDQN